MAFGQEIKRLRKEAGISAQKLADLLTVDAERLRQWERNDFTPRIEDRIKIEAFFKTTLEKVEKLQSIKKFLIEPNASIDRIIKNEAVEIEGAHDDHILKTEGIIPLPDGKFLMNTRMVPYKAYAAYLTSWGDEEYLSELPVHPIIVDQNHRGEYTSFEVGGHSMDDGSADAIQDKDIVTGRRLDRSHWRTKLHLKKFSEYVIVSLKGIVIKEITEHNTETGVITCHSRNPDKKQYPDFDLSMDKIIQIFNVVQVTKKRRK